MTLNDKVHTHFDSEGVIPTDATKIIVDDLYEKSWVLKNATNVPMNNDLVKEFSYTTGDIGAYWVSEGQKIQASKGQTVRAKLEAHKLAVFIPATEEELNFGNPRLFEDLAPRIEKAFRQKVDKAGILGLESPFKFSIDKNAVDAGNVVEGDITEDNLIEIEGKIEERFDLTDYIGSKRTATDLKRVVDAQGNKLYDPRESQLDGVDFTGLRLPGLDRGTLYGVSKDNVYVGIPREFSYKVFDAGQLTTVTNEDGTPINLAEQDMKALRVVFYVGLLIVGEGSAAKIVKAAE